MKFLVTGYGSRGDVEPCVAVGRELLRRGHDVCMAVPPNMLGLIESAGLGAVAYGPDSREVEDFRRDFAKIQSPINAVVEVAEHVTQVWAEKGSTLTSLASGADLVLAGITEQGLAANVAEYHGIPLAGLHFFPIQVLEHGWLDWQITKRAEDAQRRTLGLPAAPQSSTRFLEIQAYDQLCLPPPAAQLVEADENRPFVGAMTLELPTDADEEVVAWIADGSPPIYFGFGSMKVTSPADTVAMISAACAQLGERALICSGPNDFTQLHRFDHVKVVGAVNHSAILPVCRAVVHHGGAGTAAAGLRAGIPSLILGQWLDQPLWAAGIEHLKVGFGRRFTETTEESLVADLRLILAPHYTTRAREVATQMTKPAESLASAADLLEDTARRGRFG
jgi:UDP:flavonoid glycosyltransferase YjiC (YdhE family)